MITLRWRNVSRWVRICGLLMLSSTLYGCGDGRPRAYPTIGRVTFPDGSPAHVGTVELKSVEHSIHARGTIQPDGTFVLSTYRPDDGAIAGKHNCVVVQFIIAEDLQGKIHGTQGVIDPRFASYSTSGLTCTIEPNDNNVLSLVVEGVGKNKSGKSEHAVTQ